MKKDIKVDEATWVKLAKLKLELGVKTFDDAIVHLLKESAR